MTGTERQAGWIRRLLPFVLAHKSHVVIAFGSALVGQLVTGLLPLVQKVLIDDVVIARRRPLAPWVAALVGGAALRFGLAFVRRYWGGRIALDIQYDIRNAIYDRLQRLD